LHYLFSIKEDRLRLDNKNEWDSFCIVLGLHYLCVLKKSSFFCVT